MRNYKIFIGILIVLAFLLLGLLAVRYASSTDENQSTADLKDIKERGTLVVLSDCNSANYFIYRGAPMGFNYEVLQLFAEHVGVKLKMILANDSVDNYARLLSGECDMIAMNLNPQDSIPNGIKYTTPYAYTRMVLVQHNSTSQQKLDHQLVRDLKSLGYDPIFVPTPSAFRVAQLASCRLQQVLIIKEAYSADDEDLVEMVAREIIPYSICDENIAIINKQYFPVLDIKTIVSAKQPRAWAMRTSSSALLKDFNVWLEKAKKTSEYKFIYDKYHKHIIIAARRYRSGYQSTSGDRISVYDKLIKQYSAKINWDWRLVASLIYQESKFDTSVTSHAGAHGIMQLMPETAQRYGLDSLSSPEEHVAAGVKLLGWLDQKLKKKIANDTARKYFVLASYNAGIGHVLDAMKLAKKYGKNPQVWNNSVDYFILHKNDPRYYKNKVAEYGRCKGNETFDFVSEIMNRYEQYKGIYRE